jgi:hypothetical protein
MFWVLLNTKNAISYALLSMSAYMCVCVHMDVRLASAWMVERIFIRTQYSWVYPVTCISDYRRGLDWWTDLLTTNRS